MKKTKTKYEKQVKPKLALITAWARDGMIDKDIATKLGIGYSTLSLYRGQHPELEEALQHGKETADVEVENALFKKATGERVKVMKAIKLKEVTYGDNGKRTHEIERIDYAEEEVYIPPDTTAQIFWLKNRKPAVWRDKHEMEHSGEMEVNNPFANLTTEELRALVKKGNG